MADPECGYKSLLEINRSGPSRIAIALTHRNFRLLWMGALTSSIGTWMQKVAQAWLTIMMTGSKSAFVLGLDSFLGEVPLLLLTMVGGVFADRRDRRHMILMSQIVQMLVALVVAVLIYTRRIHIAQVLALSFIVGCVRAFGGPAYEWLLPTLVEKEHLPNAIALNSIQFNLAQVIGPFAAGAALAAFGMVACFGLNAISFLFVIAAILALRDVHVPLMATDSTVAQFRGGLRFVQGSPNLVSVMVLGFFATFLGAPLLTFLPVITRDVFHRNVGFYTQLMTFSGAGAVGCADSCLVGSRTTHGTNSTDLAHAVRHDHCWLWPLAEDLPVCIDSVHGWVAVRDVFFARHFPGAASRAAGVPWTSALYLFGRVSRWLTARWTCERMARHTSRLSAGDVAGKRYGAHVSGTVFLDPWPRPQRRVLERGEHYEHRKSLLWDVSSPPKDA